MDTCTLRYTKSAVVYSQTFNVLFAKGVDDPDQVQLFPALQYLHLDGTIVEKVIGFRRVITLDLGVISSSVDRRTITEFLSAETRSVIYQGANIEAKEIFVATEDPQSFSNEWKFDFQNARYFVLQLIEKRIRTVWPDVFTPEDLMIGYTINHVKVIGTQASPELFTTNFGKLQYNFGTTQFPSMLLTNYLITVVANGAPYQDGKINQYGTTTQNGNNIDFYLAISDIGNASADGYFYCDITFLLQDISPP